MPREFSIKAPVLEVGWRDTVRMVGKPYLTGLGKVCPSFGGDRDRLGEPWHVPFLMPSSWD